MEINNIVIENIKKIIVNSRKNVASKVNQALFAAYWEIGKEIVRNERKNKIDKQSARKVIQVLSKRLREELGRGFSRSNLFNMRRFYLEYPSVQTVSGHLTWSHI